MDWDIIAVLALAGLAVAAATVAVAAFLVRDRHTCQSDAGLADRQVRACDDIQELMDNLERLAGRIDERIDRRLAQLDNQLSQADARIAEINQKLQQDEESSHPTIRLSQATGSEIARLGKEGLETVEIARRMRMNVGEVELILSLQQSSLAKQA
jgi:TolA-binding protein